MFIYWLAANHQNINMTLGKLLMEHHISKNYLLKPTVPMNASL